MTKHLQFAIQDIDLIEETTSNSNAQFATARIQAFSSDANRHDLFCSEDTLKQTAHSLYDKPILYSIDNGLDDFYTHVRPEESLICGFVVPDTAEFIRLPDSRLALSVTAKIWKRYAPKVVELFKRDKGTKKVSVEMELFETAPLDNVLTRMVSFAYTGICILGTYVTEASPGANIQVLSFAEESQKYKEALKEEFYSVPEKITFSIPDSVKEVADKALLENKLRGGGNSVALSIAKLLHTKSELSLDEVTYVRGQIGNGRSEDINFMLCGGNSALEWSTRIINESFTPENEDPTLMEKDMENINTEEKMAVEESPKEEMAVEMADTAKSEEKETPGEEKAETPAEEKKEKEEGVEKKFEFPADFNFEVMSALFSDDEEEFAKMAKEEFAKSEAVNPQVVLSALFAKMCKMSDAMIKMAEDKKVYMAENEELKKFKADFEMSQKNFEVKQTIKELDEKVILSAEAKEEMIADAETFAFSDLDSWKTKCKAKSFDFAVRETNSKQVTRIGMPFSSDVIKPKDELWTK